MKYTNSLYLNLILVTLLIGCSLYSAEIQQPVNIKKGKKYTLSLDMLRPTQMDVGFYQVKVHNIPKLEKITKGVSDNLQVLNNALEKYLNKKSKVIPVVYGYNKKFYIIDHHHLSYSLWIFYKDKLGREFDPSKIPVYIKIIEDYSKRGYDSDKFWTEMEENNYYWPYEYSETRKGYIKYKPADLPKTIGGLGNDPYRSAIGMAQKQGGIEKPPKDELYFYQFKWGMCVNTLGFKEPADGKIDSKTIKDTQSYLLKNSKKMMNYCIGPEYIDMPKPTPTN